MSVRPRPEVESLPAYTPGRSAAAAMADHQIDRAIKLASNESSLGPLGGAMKAMEAASAEVNRYPDNRASALRSLLAEHVAVLPERVTVGCGSVGLIQQLCLAYGGPGREILFARPSFEAYPVFAQLSGSTSVEVPVRRQTIDAKAIAAAFTERTSLAFVASPNNPTGTALRTTDLIAIAEATPSTCLLVIDAAYQEFVTGADVPDAIDLLADRPNVVVLRTFSKAYGLAALRVGYMVGAPEVVSNVDKVALPFTVNSIAQAAALASLDEVGEMQERAKLLVAERLRVSAELRKQGFPVPDTQANFVWLPAADGAADLGLALERQGVVTRVFPGVGVRVTIGTPSENDLFLQAFNSASSDSKIAAAWALPTESAAAKAGEWLERLDQVEARLSAARGPHARRPDGPGPRRGGALEPRRGVGASGRIRRVLAEGARSCRRRSAGPGVRSDEGRPGSTGRRGRWSRPTGGGSFAHRAASHRRAAGPTRRTDRGGLGQDGDALHPGRHVDRRPAAALPHRSLRRARRSARGTGGPMNASNGFGIDHLPYGVIRHGGRTLCVARYGDEAIDLAALDLSVDPATFTGPTLNRFCAAGADAWMSVREELQSRIENDEALPTIALADAEPVLPVEVGDYVDFYSSLHHATNLGRLFRPDSEPLLPNWRHLPIGYHGRSGTVAVSGTPVRRPSGLVKDGDAVVHRACRNLDIELEVGFVVGPSIEAGSCPRPDEAAEHVFGVCLVNDWSARDIQAFEYQPLGPFLGKSFLTTMSAWITPMEALRGSLVQAPVQEPQPADHLRASRPWGLDLDLEVELNGTVISRANFGDLYWTFAQQLSHMTSNGASARPGDLFASGTVSGPEPGTYGSLIELSWRGENPIELADGSTRTFLEDGDTVILRGSAAEGSVALGSAEGTVVGS